MITRLTRPGRVFLGLVAALYLAALTSQSGLLLLLVGVVLGCMVINFLAARRSVRLLDLEVPRHLCLSEGQRLWQPWRVRNPGRTPASLVQVESPAGVVLRLAHLAPRSEVQAAPDLVFARRGVHPHGRLTLSSRFPFGLVQAARTVSLPGEVVVYPALYEVSAPQAAGFDLMVGGRHRRGRQAASGGHFAGVRPHQPGDPLKQIHWRSSAKGRGLMVRTYDEELSGRVGVVLDAGHTGQEDRLDPAVRAAGSLLVAALQAGHHAEWIALGGGEPARLTPFADERELLDALARLPLSPGCLRADRLAHALGSLSRRSALHLVLTAWNEDAAQAVDRLASQRRSVTVYLPEGVAGSADPAVPVVRFRAHGLA